MVQGPGRPEETAATGLQVAELKRDGIYEPLKGVTRQQGWLCCGERRCLQRGTGRPEEGYRR